MRDRKSYPLKYKKRNKVLERAILERWSSVSAFCRERRFSDVEIGRLINLKRSPLRKNGDYLPICIWLSHILHLDCEDLFPLRLYGLRKPARRNEIAFSCLPPSVEILQIPDDRSLVESLFLKEMRIWFDDLFDYLIPRDAEIIKLLYGLDGEEHTSSELAVLYGVSHTRVYLIKKRALAKLREIIVERWTEEGFIEEKQDD